MGRRRLLLHCSDDDDDAEAEADYPPPSQPDTRASPQLHSHTICPPPPHPHFPAIEIPDQEDEEARDFIDVSEDLSPPSPPAASVPRAGAARPASAPALASVPSATVSDSTVTGNLARMGLVLRRAWMCACLTRLEGSVRGFPGLDVATKSKLCFEQFLLSDMNRSGAGVLPANVDALHLVDLAGPFVLQVDEIVNISCPLRGRYQNASAALKRCLKLSMTDGVQRVFGMEYRPVKDLEPLAPAGFKVCLHNVHVRHGLLMLVPESIEVLGGMVAELERARERLVVEVNKPPRGRRTRSGEIPPVANRATRAAWTSDNVNNVSSGDHIMEDVNDSRSERTGVTTIPIDNMRNSAEPTGALSFQNEIPDPSSNFISDFEEMHMGGVTSLSANHSVNMEDIQVDSAPANSGNAVTSPSPGHVSAVSEMVKGETAIPDLPQNAILEPEVIQIVDEGQHPHILCGVQEVPFTYLASLSAKWAAMRDRVSSIEGKIKCFLTGVKSFQYKQRVTYELRVYVDDGSLISEILIDHNVVQNGIGRTPKEVTAALSSPDKKVASGMRATLKQFQLFLANFEGTMLIEMNGASPVPVARQMTKGCTSSDAWLLLKRLVRSQPLAARPTSDPIELSP